MTVEEVAQLLRISKSTIYKMTMDNRIPHYKVGAKLLFKRHELIDFVENQRAPQCTEILDRFSLLTQFGKAA